MLDKLMTIQKSIKENDIMSYYPSININRIDNEDTEYRKKIVFKGKAFTVEVGEFIGYGDTLAGAVVDLIEDYKKFVKEETDFEEDMFDFFEELKK